MKFPQGLLSMGSNDNRLTTILSIFFWKFGGRHFCKNNACASVVTAAKMIALNPFSAPLKVALVNGVYHIIKQIKGLTNVLNKSEQLGDLV